MRHQCRSVAAVLAAFCLPMVGQISPAKSQASATPAPAAKSKKYTPPKTPWGDPDIQGNWPAQFNIPRTRPENVKESVLSDEEFAQRQAQTEKQFKARLDRFYGGRGLTIGGIGKAHKQTSLGVGP